ncbi:MAG: type II CAAX endopeptidase family protein [Actinomycetota bacterium]
MENSTRKTWGTFDVIWSMSAVLGGIFMLQYIRFGASALGNSLYLTTSYLYIFFVVLVFTVVKYGNRLSDLGLKPLNPARALALAIGWWFAIRVVILVYSVVVTTIAERFGARPPAELTSRVPELFGSGAVGFLLACLVAVFIGPIVEEIYFRGFIYPAFKRALGPWPAMILSGAVFGVFHVNPWLIFPTGLMGVIMAYLYEKEGSLAAPFFLHALNNLVSVVIVYTLYVK